MISLHLLSAFHSLQSRQCLSYKSQCYSWQVWKEHGSTVSWGQAEAEGRLWNEGFTSASQVIRQVENSDVFSLSQPILDHFETLHISIWLGLLLNLESIQLKTEHSPDACNFLLLDVQCKFHVNSMQLALMSPLRSFLIGSIDKACNYNDLVLSSNSQIRYHKMTSTPLVPLAFLYF